MKTERNLKLFANDIKKGIFKCGSILYLLLIPFTINFLALTGFRLSGSELREYDVLQKGTKRGQF